MTRNDRNGPGLELDNITDPLMLYLKKSVDKSLSHGGRGKVLGQRNALLTLDGCKVNSNRGSEGSSAARVAWVLILGQQPTLEVFGVF